MLKLMHTVRGNMLQQMHTVLRMLQQLHTVRCMMLQLMHTVRGNYASTNAYSTDDASINAHSTLYCCFN